MSNPTPSRILLATDLSARSDRALDRAVGLAQEWGAELIVAHVIDPVPNMFDDDPQEPSWRRSVDPAELALARVRRDLGDLEQEVRVIVANGKPAAEIAALASREGCDLIVTGVARDETLGRMFLGSTVERLLRISPIPVLVVKRRAARAYDDILVAVDFSAASAQALRRTADLFPKASITALHGFDASFRLESSSQKFGDYLRQAEQEEAEALLEKAGLEADARARTQVLIEYGNPVRLVESYVQNRDPALLVIGSHGRSALFELAIGSIAKVLTQMIDTDILLVRGGASA